MDSHVTEIRSYILENFLFTRDSTVLSDDTSFLESGIIDSTGILEIMNFLEDRFGIKIEDDEVVPENLDSIERIVGYLSRKMHGDDIPASS